MITLDDDCIFIDVDDTLIQKMTPNFNLIGKIKQWKDAGRTIIVWTSNADGVNHALKAINLCQIEYLVDVVMPKPRTIVDDDHLEYYQVIDPDTLTWRDK
jgi:hypothetical protein